MRYALCTLKWITYDKDLTGPTRTKIVETISVFATGACFGLATNPRRNGAKVFYNDLVEVFH